uniref:Centromere/kinetochore protein zw10 middle domain-containing protein n=1 Tax=Aegilops tauschii subsp. strangulata TaxID=200361 RepID=A0A453SHV1_AEGTS
SSTPPTSSRIPVVGEPAMADDVRELLLSTTADADPSTPLSAPDLRLLIDHLRHRSDHLHASALSFAASNREPLASALLRAASSAASSASLQSSLQSALSPLSSSPDLSDLRSLSDRLVAARRELRERQEHLAAASSVASLSARLRAARASANPLDAAAAAAELKPLLVNPEGSGSGGDEPVVFGLLRGEWEQLVDELQVGLSKNVEECVEFAPDGGKVAVRAGPSGSSSGTPGVELRVALQALEVRFTCLQSTILEDSGLIRQIIDSLDYGMAKVADLMIKHVFVPAISNISVTVSVEVLEKSGSTYPASVLNIVPSEELQAVPDEASKLIGFQDVIRSTTEFENTLRGMMFISPDRKDGKLTQFVDDVEVHFAVRKRNEILVKARYILVQYDYKNPLASDDHGDSVVDLLFQPEKCFISKSALQLMKLVHGALKLSFSNTASHFSVFCRMLVCRPQESQRSFAMLLGMPCSCIRLLCQFS